MHAVRWARRYLKRAFTYDWTRWHATEDSNLTLCGVAIPIAMAGGTFFPETDDELLFRLDCKRCMAVLKGKSK